MQTTPALPFPVFEGLSAVASLELSTDGAINHEHRRLAEAHDRAAPRSSARIRIARPRLKPAAVQAIIITAIEKAALRGDALTREDLKRLGLTDQDIDGNQREAVVRFAIRNPQLARCAEVQ